MRKRVATIFLALLTAVGLVVAAVPAAADPQNKLTSSSKPINFTGTDQNQNPVTAQFRPDRAVLNEAGNGVNLIGEMKVKTANGNAKKSDALVAVLPDTSSPAAPQTRAAAPGDVTAAALAPCDVLNLVLGPLSLNLLGLHIDLQQVVLDITADPFGGLLGSLLCSLAGGPTGGALSGLLNQIIGILNQILGGLGGA